MDKQLIIMTIGLFIFVFIEAIFKEIRRRTLEFVKRHFWSIVAPSVAILASIVYWRELKVFVTAHVWLCIAFVSVVLALYVAYLALRRKSYDFY